MASGLLEKDDVDLADHDIVKAVVAQAALTTRIPPGHGGAVTGNEQVAVLVGLGEFIVKVRHAEAVQKGDGGKSLGRGFVAK